MSAAGVGLATWWTGGLLDVWYPQPGLGAEAQTVPGLDAAARPDDLRGVEVRTVRTVIEDLQAPPADVADAYLRLHLLSHRLVQPRTINLDGIFGQVNRFEREGGGHNRSRQKEKGGIRRENPRSPPSSGDFKQPSWRLA